MTAHDHADFVPGCFRCDLSREEVAAQTPDHIARAAEVLTEAWKDRIEQGISDAPEGHCYAFADALADAGLLATPERDAAVAAKTLREAANEVYGDERAAGQHWHPLSAASWLRDRAARIEAGESDE